MRITRKNNEVYLGDSKLIDVDHTAITSNLLLMEKENDKKLLFLVTTPRRANELKMYYQNEKEFERLKNIGFRKSIYLHDEIIAFMGGYINDELINLAHGEVLDGYKRSSIMTKMVRYMESLYPQAKLRFNKLSREGKPFVKNNFSYAEIGE